MGSIDSVKKCLTDALSVLFEVVLGSGGGFVPAMLASPERIVVDVNLVEDYTSRKHHGA